MAGSSDTPEERQMAAIQEYHRITGRQLEAFPLISVFCLCSVPLLSILLSWTPGLSWRGRVVAPGHQVGLRLLMSRGLGSPVLALVALHQDRSRGSGTGFNQIGLTRSMGKKGVRRVVFHETDSSLDCYSVLNTIILPSYIVTARAYMK